MKYIQEALVGFLKYWRWMITSNHHAKGNILDIKLGNQALRIREKVDHLANKMAQVELIKGNSLMSLLMSKVSLGMMRSLLNCLE